MEPSNYQTLIFFSLFFSLIVLNSAKPVCIPKVPTNSNPSTNSQAANTTQKPPAPQPTAPDSPDSDPPAAAPQPTSQTAPDSPDSHLPPPPTAAEQKPEPPHKSIISGFANIIGHHPHGGATIPDPEVKKICDSTDYPDICMLSITPRPGRTDVPSVVELAIRAATAHAKLAVATAEHLASSPATPRLMVPILNDCKDSYSDALDNFQSAMDALATKDVGTMNSMLSAAITDASDCGDELAGKATPLTDFNSKLTKMTSNCLAIVSQIKTN